MKAFTLLSTLGAFIVASTFVSAAPVAPSSADKPLSVKLISSVPDNTTQAPTGDFKAQGTVNIQLDEFLFENEVWGIVSQHEAAKMKITILESGYRESMNSYQRMQNAVVHYSEKSSFAFQTVTKNCGSKTYQFYFFYAGQKHLYDAGEIHSCDGNRLNKVFYAMAGSFSIPFNY